MKTEFHRIREYSNEPQSENMYINSINLIRFSTERTFWLAYRITMCIIYQPFWADPHHPWLRLSRVCPYKAPALDVPSESHRLLRPPRLAQKWTVDFASTHTDFQQKRYYTNRSDIGTGESQRLSLSLYTRAIIANEARGFVSWEGTIIITPSVIAIHFWKSRLHAKDHYNRMVLIVVIHTFIFWIINELTKFPDSTMSTALVFFIHCTICW